MTNVQKIMVMLTSIITAESGLLSVCAGSVVC